MNFTVRNEKGKQVGKVTASLDEAHDLIAANDGYSKGWYIEPIRENVEVPQAPTFLTEG